MSVMDKIAELGLTLPQPPEPVAAYIPAVRTGDLIFVSGQIPLVSGQLRFQGRVADEITSDLAQEAAKICALNCLAVVSGLVGLDDVERVVKLNGYVASAPDFFEQPKVINGASQMIQNIFGDAGQHARAAVGVSALPMGATVEIEMIVQVKRDAPAL